MEPGKPTQRLSAQPLEVCLFLAQLQQQACHMHVSWQHVLENKGMYPWGLSCRRGFALRDITEYQCVQVDGSMLCLDCM